MTIVGAAIVGLGCYQAAMLVAGSRHERALDNAGLMLALERRLGLDWERAVQGAVLGHRSWMTVSNWLYTWTYWPWVGGILVVCYFVDRSRFRVCRDALLVSGAVGLVVFVVFPLAPPRMLDGFVDTIAAAGQSTIAHPEGLTNEYAAMPSFHVGWMVMTGIVAGPLVRRGLRWLLALPGALMYVSVVLTANHYVLDGIAGIALGLLALRVAAWFENCRSARRGGEMPIVEGRPLPNDRAAPSTSAPNPST